jgi:hypothetical protein
MIFKVVILSSLMVETLEILILDAMLRTRPNFITLSRNNAEHKMPDSIRLERSKN